MLSIHVCHGMLLIREGVGVGGGGGGVWGLLEQVVLTDSDRRHGVAMCDDVSF